MLTLFFPHSLTESKLCVLVLHLQHKAHGVCSKVITDTFDFGCVCVCLLLVFFFFFDTVLVKSFRLCKTIISIKFH